MQFTLSPIYYLVALALAGVIVASSNATSREYDVVYERLSPSEQIDTTLKSFLETLTFGLYEGGSEKEAGIKGLIASAESYRRIATAAAWALFALSVVFIVYVHWSYRRRGMAVASGLSGHLLGVAMVFLVIGLCAPILSLVAYKDVAILGQVVFKYESKGIFTTIHKLVTSGNAFVGCLLLLFSVVTPVVKLVLCFMVLAASQTRRRSHLIAIIKGIGKWSMADVLVVAILLAFFAVGADQTTDSWLGHGLYFFAGYCVLSLAAGHVIVHLEDKRLPALILTSDGGGGRDDDRGAGNGSVRRGNRTDHNAGSGDSTDTARDGPRDDAH